MNYEEAKKATCHLIRDYIYSCMGTFTRDYLKYHDETSKNMSNALDEFTIHFYEATTNFLNNEINIEKENENEQD